MGAAASTGSRAAKEADKVFGKVDTDKNGKLSVAELSAASQKYGAEIKRDWPLERIEATGGKIVYTPHARVFHHLNEDQATVDYYRRWHRGYGTAMERMRPNHTFVRDAAKVVEQAFQYLAYSLRLRLPDGARNLRAHRKQAQALGRIEELLGR